MWSPGHWRVVGAMTQKAKISPGRSAVGVALAVGAGIGIVIGVIMGGGAGIAIGAAIGAGIGVVVGAVWDGSRLGRCPIATSPRHDHHTETVRETGSGSALSLGLGCCAARGSSADGRMSFMENGPGWAGVTTWVVVNVVNLAQTVGFASRRTHGMAVNHVAGYLIAGLAVPATAALVGYARACSPWWIGPAVFDGFVALMLVVDYLRPVQFRNPRRPIILVPPFGLRLSRGLK